MAFFQDHRRWAFIHIPKNGGYAVYLWAIPHLGPKAHVMMEGGVTAAFIGHDVTKHSPATAYRQWMRETGRDWDAYKTFAILRPPLERPQSVFSELRNRSKSAYWTRADPEWWDRLDSLADANEFVLSGMYDPDGPFGITKTQRWFVSDDSGLIVKHLFLMRTMAEDVPRFLGLPGPIPRAHDGQYVPAPLSPEAEAVVREKYATDFDLLQEVFG